MKTRITTGKNTDVEIINTGNFLLDGGSMFGRIPKVMWNEWFECDDKNRITMATNILKFKKKDRTYIVDAGIGTNFNEKMKAILGIDCPDIELEADTLICSHLHFDHIGGIHNIKNISEVIVSPDEWKDATTEEDPLTRGSYRKIDTRAIEPVLRLVTPPSNITDGIELISTPGHTRGHMSVLIDDEILFAGDLIPTSAHVHLPCIMAYDIYPMELLETKTAILEKASEKGWTVVFEHDPLMPAGKIKKNKTTFSFLPLDPENIRG